MDCKVTHYSAFQPKTPHFSIYIFVRNNNLQEKECIFLQITIGLSKIRTHLSQTIKDKQNHWEIQRIFVPLQAKPSRHEQNQALIR